MSNATEIGFVGDALAYEFELQDAGGNPLPLPSATLEAAILSPSGEVIPATAAFLAAPEDHVVRVTVAAGQTSVGGRHDMQLRVTDASLLMPMRGRVLWDLIPSAV